MQLRVSAPVLVASTQQQRGLTCFLDALTGFVHIRQGKRKVAKACSQVVARLPIVVCQLQTKVLVLWSIAQEHIGVLLLYLTCAIFSAAQST